MSCVCACVCARVCLQGRVCVGVRVVVWVFVWVFFRVRVVYLQRLLPLGHRLLVHPLLERLHLAHR
jgi:hypothetical protein